MIVLQKRMLDADYWVRNLAIGAAGVVGLLFLGPMQIAISLSCYYLADHALGVAINRLIAEPHSVWRLRQLQAAGFLAMSTYLAPMAMVWQLPGLPPKIGGMLLYFGGMLSVMLVRAAFLPLTVANSLPLVGIVFVIAAIETDQPRWQDQAFLGLSFFLLASYFVFTLVAIQRIYRELAEARDAALVRVETQKRFLATMSHELRMPLNGILGMAQNMANRQTDSGAETICDSAREMVAMVDDLLDNAAIEAGALRINAKPTDLTAMMGRIGDRWQAPFAAKGLNLSLILASDVPKAAVIDPLRLSQCLSNLLTNALRLTSQGGVSLALSRHPLGLEAVITDTGPGLPAEAEARLFRPSEAVQPIGNTVGPSTGLGLSITRGLARAMGGDLVFERPSEGGSRFRLTLSAPDADVAAVETDLPNDRAVLTAGLQGKRILLVDDIATNRLVLRLLLSGLGADPVEAVSGAEALALLADPAFSPPDAVLMDIRMPGLSGFDTLARIRAMGFRPPIIAVSADAAPEGRAEALAHGFDGYLTKPVEQAELRCLLTQALARTRHL